MKQRILFRTDGGSLVGMGHVVSCMALAEMLEEDFEIFFVMQETDMSVMEIVQSVATSVIILPSTEDFGKDAANFSKYIKSTDIVVLDGYNFKNDYQRMIKTKGAKLVCIDVLHDYHQEADVIINYSEGISLSDYSHEPYTRLFSGLDYVLLRKIFLEPIGDSKVKNNVRKIFVSMGSADVLNLTFKFSEALMKLDGVEELHLMLGAENANTKDVTVLSTPGVKIVAHRNISSEEIKALLMKCDLAVCPASTIALECCATGIGLVAGLTTPNQAGLLKILKQFNAAMDLGNLVSIDADEIIEKMSQLISDPRLINEQIASQSEMIDGKSPERIRKIFRELLPKKLSFRFASITDADQYFKWANDPGSALNFFVQVPIDFSEHLKWFKSNLISDDNVFYLFQDDRNKAVGQVRIVRRTQESIVDFSLDEKFKEMSHGPEMLKQACDDFHKRHPGVTIFAYVKAENKSAYDIFRQAGFDNEELVTEQGKRNRKLSLIDKRGD